MASKTTAEERAAEAERKGKIKASRVRAQGLFRLAATEVGKGNYDAATEASANASEQAAIAQGLETHG